MNIVAGIQVYEEEDFIRPTILSLLSFCNKVVIVEGCWKSTLSLTKSKRSRDNTIDIIKDIMKNSDPDNKIELHHYNGTNQIDHRRHILNICMKYNPDWYLQGDGDEIFHDKEIPLLVNELKTTDKVAFFKSYS